MNTKGSLSKVIMLWPDYSQWKGLFYNSTTELMSNFSSPFSLNHRFLQNCASCHLRVVMDPNL